MFDLIEDYWARALGIRAEPGVQVAVSHDDWNGILVVSTPAGIRILAPPGLCDAIRRLATTQKSGLLGNRAFWQKHFPNTEILGPNLHHYLADATHLVNHPAVRQVDADAVAGLRTECSSEDWAESGFDRQPLTLFGAFNAHRIVGAANLTAWDNRAADVGLLTLANARGAGWGTQLAAAATAWSIRQHGIARYRALDTNGPSLAIARRLGYIEYGSHLAIRL